MKIQDYKNYLLTYLHKPYLWAGSSPIDGSGLDCSGAVQEWLAPLGLDPKGDQTAHALYLHFLNLPHTDDDSLGALYFYGTKERVTHVAMAFDCYTIIEAGGGGSSTTSTEAAIKQNAFIRLRPYNHRKDLVAILRSDALDKMLYD